MPDADITSARYDDDVVAALVAELQEEYVERYGGPDETPVDPDEFAPPGGAFLVLHIDGSPAGCVGLRRHDATAAEMKRLFVRRPLRGRGLAHRLLTRAEEEARAMGYRRLVLETGLAQPEAIALYTGRGYDPIPGFGHYRDSDSNRCFAREL